MRDVKNAWWVVAALMIAGCGGGGGGGSASTSGGGGGTVIPTPTRVVIEGATNSDLAGVGAVGIRVYNSSKTLIATITSDAVGNTSMPILPAGTYYIAVVRTTSLTRAYYASFQVGANSYLLDDANCPAPIVMTGTGELAAGSVRLTPRSAPPPPPPSCL